MGTTGDDVPIDEEDFQELANRVGDIDSTANSAERIANEALDLARTATAEIERLHAHIEEMDALIAKLRRAVGQEL